MQMTRKGQTTAEYAVVVGVVIAAIVAMQIYVKRGVQAKVKDATDFFTSSGAEVGTTAQYEPYYADSSYDVTQSRKSTDSVEEGGIHKRTGIDESTTRTGTSKTVAPSSQP